MERMVERKESVATNAERALPSGPLPLRLAGLRPHCVLDLAFAWHSAVASISNACRFEPPDSRAAAEQRYASRMTTLELANQFVEMCKEGKNFDVMQQLYADDIVSVEAMLRKTGSFETVGKSAVIQKSAEWAGAHEIHGATVDGPFLLGNEFAVLFDFDVTPVATGQRVSNREVAVYTVEDGLIVREEFFYGPGADALAR